MAFWPAGKSLASLCRVAAAAALVIAPGLAPAYAVVGISGTMSNFDVFNETSTNVYGAELELEGVHSIDVTKTFPSHFNNMTTTEYSNGATFGTRITFTGYNFDPSGFIIPTVGQSTNGHYAVNLPGCEHFGFAVTTQPTATRFFWLGQTSQRIGTTPLSIPSPSWTYVPPAVPGGAPVVQAVVQVPQPEQPQPQIPDAIWMKVYETELDRPVDLLELLSGPGVVPQEAAEIETEWELLDGGMMSMAGAPVGNNKVSVIRRYEFFKYTGPYNADHEPTPASIKGSPPLASELGEFIAANMGAAILDVPEPSAWVLLFSGLGMLGWMARRRRWAG
jgi:hypothetical protein